MKSSTHLIGLPGLSNVGVVVDGRIYRGAQPEQEGYQTLSNLSIRTIINLRTTEGVDDWAAYHGIAVVSYPFREWDVPEKDVTLAILEALDSEINQPVYCHCNLGENRTGYISAAYRIIRQGWTPKEAWEELLSFIRSPIGEPWPNIKHAIWELRR